MRNNVFCLVGIEKNFRIDLYAIQDYWQIWQK